MTRAERADGLARCESFSRFATAPSGASGAFLDDQMTPTVSAGSPELGDRHPAAAGLRLCLAVLHAIRAGGEELLHRLAQRTRADPVHDTDLRSAGAHRPVEERLQRRERVTSPLADEVDLSGLGVGIGTV